MACTLNTEMFFALQRSSAQWGRRASMALVFSDLLLYSLDEHNDLLIQLHQPSCSGMESFESHVSTLLTDVDSNKVRS